MPNPIWAVNATKATALASALFNIIQEPAVQKSWIEVGRSTIDTGRSTQAAVRETREAWKRHR